MAVNAEQYDETYGREDPRFAEWRSICARLKVEHVVSLLDGADVSTIIDIGCGDGALLEQFSANEFGDQLNGYEIARSAVDQIRCRNIPRVSGVEMFDGERIPVADASFDLAILSHVLEHTADPVALLGEAGRVARQVVFEVPLEATLFSHRPGYRKAAAEIGHIQKFSLASARQIAADTHMSIHGELISTRTRVVQQFWADTWAARLRANAVWGATGLVSLWPSIGRRLVAHDYTCRCR